MRDILQNRQVTTRKPHQCFGCGRTFPTGTLMGLIVQVDDGEFDRMYWCYICSAYWHEYYQHGDEINEGELRTENPEGYAEFEAALTAEEKPCMLGARKVGTCSS